MNNEALSSTIVATGVKISEQEADVSLQQAIKLSPVLGQASQGKQAAIAIFIAVNGADAYRKSALKVSVDEKQWEHARMEILKWSKRVHNQFLTQADLFSE
jgi:hypothetical protein